jgi:hypothetical protein
MVRTPKERIKKTSIGPLNACNKPINLILRAIKAIKESLATPLHLIRTDSFLLTSASDLTIIETLNTNRRGRIVALL